MPSKFFTLSQGGDLETISVTNPGTENYTDADGIVKERALTAVSVADVDVQPASGYSRLLPEGVRNTAEYVAYVDLSASAAAKRAALVAGRTILRADASTKMKITWVGDWSTHIVLALVGE